ncbi:hypothetical protein ACLOJK_010592 [Asimina triloba]
MPSLLLQNNEISGPIPFEIGTLSGLQTLDLSGQEDYEFEMGHLKRFSFRELQVATDNFSRKNILGQGGFGVVYKGFLRNGKVVAVKRLKDPNFTGEVQFQTEVEMIGLVLHRNLLRLYGFCLTSNERLLVYPYMTNGSVADRLRGPRHEKPSLDWNRRMQIALGAARGLLYLHEQCNPKIIHRDVKAANILLDESFEAVVGDFGLAKLLDRRDSHVTTAVRGTLGHIAPEYLSTGQSSEKTDVYGFGILILELVTGYKALYAANGPFQKGMILDWVRGAYEEKRLDALVDVELGSSYNVDELEKAVGVALLCTQSDPSLRPRMSEVARVLETMSGTTEHMEDPQGVPCGRVCSFSRSYSNYLDESSFIVEAMELSGPSLFFPCSKFQTRSSVTSHPSSNSSPSACQTRSSHRFDTESYGRLLDTCVLEQNLGLGKVIHAKVVVNDCEEDSYLATKLIGFYSCCGNLPIAESIFNRLSSCNIYLMNAMIRGFSANGLYKQAIDFFFKKHEEGIITPDSYTFSALLKACGSLQDISYGKKIRNLILESGLVSDLFVSNSLIAMFAKCGSLTDGIEVFERMPQRDIVSWNSVISAYAQNGFDWEAMVTVREMANSGLKPDPVTLVCASTICSSAATCREIHGYVMRNGLELTPMVSNSLISMYGKCGRTKEARLLFDNSIPPDNVAWNSVISSYAQNGCFRESIQLLREMKLAGFVPDAITYSGIISSFSQNGQSHEAMRIFEEMLSSKLNPDVITIASILPAVSDLKYIGYCKEIHAHSYRNELESDRRVRNALISVYAKCGSIQNAISIFGEIDDKDVISWSSMVVGYAQNGYFNEAIDTFRLMIRAVTEPNPITITSVLSACAGVSSLRQGKEIHLWAIKNGFENQTFVGSALIDMYAKCGRIRDSERVFDLVEEKNLVTWNSMIGGYAVHGLAESALDIFWRLEEPDCISFLAAISACNHGGLVNEGIEIFNSMQHFGVSPREGHYACMVDLLGRAGRLHQALGLIRSMPMEASADIWGALLGACKLHSDLEVGVYAGKRVMELGCENPGYYTLLSNILADFGRWEDVEMMRKLMKKRGMKKGVGCSWIEVDKRVQCFVAKERAQHPEWRTLFQVLKGLNEQSMAARGG